MYLVTIHVPIYVAGDRRLVTTEWHRSIELLRDSLGGRFGELHILAPSLQVESATPEQQLREMTVEGDGVRLIPSFDLGCRAREYWATQRKRWRADLESEVSQADMVHAGLDDVYRPISYAGFLTGVRYGRPTIFVQDTDIGGQIRELAEGKGIRAMGRAWAYSRIYESLCRHGVRLASLSLMKGASLNQRYAGIGRNAREFQDTSHNAADVVPIAALDARVASLAAGRGPRLVYCGRLIARKGVDRSIQLVKRAREQGVDVSFDIIGDGPERAALESLAAESGLSGFVRFLGTAEYGPRLLSDLAGYDALLFTPPAEDTPRMIFDGYAAGLPLIASDIPYARERSAEEGATLLLPRKDLEGSVDRLTALLNDPARMGDLATRARRGGLFHTSESWYHRRADWTFEAFERHHRTTSVLAF